MSTFRIILAFLFSLLIVWGIWKYYTWNDQVALQDPFKSIRSKLVKYEVADVAPRTPKDALTDLPSTDKDDITWPSIGNNIHKDFSFGSLTTDELTRITQLGIAGGSPQGDIPLASLLWFRCDLLSKIVWWRYWYMII